MALGHPTVIICDYCGIQAVRRVYVDVESWYTAQGHVMFADFDDVADFYQVLNRQKYTCHTHLGEAINWIFSLVGPRVQVATSTKL